MVPKVKAAVKIEMKRSIHIICLIPNVADVEHDAVLDLWGEDLCQTENQRHFSQLCLQLIDVLAGNFCPICRKCYTDDDWESKMVQCSLCESWVHARCEGLTGWW